MMLKAFSVMPLSLLTGLLLVVKTLGDERSPVMYEIEGPAGRSRASWLSLDDINTGTSKSKRYHSSGKHRRLQGFQFQQSTVDYGDRDEFENIRIRFLTEPLESLRGSNADLDGIIDSIIGEILPAVEAKWASHLVVTPAAGPIPITTANCGVGFDYGPLMAYGESGVDNADLAIAVFMDTSVEQCGLSESSSALAFAFPCTLDQFDRPIFGVINFCKPPTDEDQVNDAKLVAIHEVAHILGQDSSLFKYFRDPATGEPLTPRPFQSRTVTCVDGSQKTMVFPSENTLRLGESSLGLLHYDLVTPRVTTVVRNHFGCQSLQGARLENQPTAAMDCSGTHWDERLFFNELMSAIIELGGSVKSNVLSPLTLALMEDSGWYRVNYAGAQLLPFGQGRGCDFVNQDCIANDGVPEYGIDTFCQSPLVFDGELANDVDNPVLCNPSHTTLALCDLFDRATAPPGFNLETNLGYFSNPDLVSSSAQPDFCPLTSLELGIDCMDTSLDAGFQFYPEEVYGPDSRCVNAIFDGTIRYENGTTVTGSFQRGACVPVSCDRENFRVIVAGQVCDFDGQVLEAAQGALFQCPRLSTICPDLYCAGSCSGRGVCNYDVVPPQCECFDAEDSSPLCNVPSSGPTFKPTTPVPTSRPIPLDTSGVETDLVSTWFPTVLYAAMAACYMLL